MSATLERQIRPIYDALDTHSYKSAVSSCNKILKKHPNNAVVKALKALALIRQQKVEDSLVLCDEILALNSTDEQVLGTMVHVLKALGRMSDIAKMYESAFKQLPSSEELGVQTFFAHCRAGNWKAAQQVATKLHKLFREDRFLYWNVFSAVLQAKDSSTLPGLRPVLLKLAHRLLSTTSTPPYFSPDRLYVHLVVLRELELYDEALTVLDHDISKALCSMSLMCNEQRREIMKLKGLVKEEGEKAQSSITNPKKKDRNWLEFISVLDAAFFDIASTSGPSDESQAPVVETIGKTRDFLEQIVTEDGPKDRSALLALLELEKRLHQHALSPDTSALGSMAERYFSQFGHKASCFEDLTPYLGFEGDSLAKWTSSLETLKGASFESASDLQRGINVFKLLRHNLVLSEITPELETSRAEEYVHAYLDSLKFGEGLPDTELQPADDLAILAGSAYTSLWKLTADESHLHTAVAFLEYASSRSKQCFRIRLQLIRIYHLLGTPSLALEHYRFMNIKQVQTDTLSHLVLTRAATTSLSALGDLTYSSECMEASQIYMSNSQETAEFVARAFSSEKYSQLFEFTVFEDRLDNSLQRDLHKIEHVRMRLPHEQINADLVDMELIELKFIFDRLHHDNRDFDIIPNYQPKCLPTFNEQTLPYGKVPGAPWLAAFLKIYIKVFQQASDLDDSVEDKLLIGDRPKPNNGPENKLPLNERLAMRKQEEFDDLTPVEQALYDYGMALTEWLGPYHDHIRPPPSALLAEVSRQNELKPGHPLRALAAAPPSQPSNGHAKKNDEPPAVTEPPEIILKFFEDMKSRFDSELGGSKLPPELLHVLHITQEAYLLFAVETTRFKSASIVKAHKLGALVQSFKDIRVKAASILTEMSADMIKLSEQVATPETRAAFVEASKSIQVSSGFTHDFVSNIAKIVTDSRKDTYEGVGKCVEKVLKNHS